MLGRVVHHRHDHLVEQRGRAGHDVEVAVGHRVVRAGAHAAHGANLLGRGSGSGGGRLGLGLGQPERRLAVAPAVEAGEVRRPGRFGPARAPLHHHDGAGRQPAAVGQRGAAPSRGRPRAAGRAGRAAPGRRAGPASCAGTPPPAPAARPRGRRGRARRRCAGSRRPPRGRSRPAPRGRRRGSPPPARAPRTRRTGRAPGSPSSSPSWSSRENSASRTRSEVGRVSRPAGTTSVRPRALPAMIRVTPGG